MDDSIINPILLSSSIHLKNAEQLIQNLEKQTLNVDIFEDILSNTLPINDISDDNFLINSIKFPNDNENLSMKSFLTQSNDQYDTHEDYRLTFNIDKSFDQKFRRQKSSSRYSDDDILSNVANNINNWSMRSSFEHLITKPQQIRSQSNPPSSSSSKQQISNHNNSSRSSSTSWRQMKENQRTTTEIPTKETRPSSLFNLYKIFQQKSNITALSSFRNASQLYRQQNNSIIPNHTNEIIVSKSKSYNHLTTPTLISSSSRHKSLPDLSFISKYSKELPRSLTTSPLPPTSLSSINIARTTPSPILIQQQKQDSDRPRTLKSIKRYKNNKHSTEPLGVCYSPQLHKTFTTIPTSSFQSGREQTLNIKSSLSNNLQNSSQENQTKQSVISTENISKHFISPCNPSNTYNDHLSLLTKRYGEMRRCQTDIIVVDPILHRYSLTDSPPNEFCLQPDEDEEILIEKSHINIIPNLDESVPLSDQSLITMNTSILDNILERINDIVKRLYEIKRSDKTIFLNNEHNLQLDSLLKNDLCTAIQNILEHGRKDLKKITLWKIIQISIEQNTSSSEQIPRAYYEAKQIAQNASSHWLYKFQAFIFALLNKNELINWLYYFTRQKDIIQHYYQSPNALILVSISSTFNLFERIMTQLEKLTSLVFHLTYHLPSNDDQLNTSIITTHSTKTNARDWVMTLSRRTSKNSIPTNSNNTFRSTLSKKFNAIFTKPNTSVVTTKLPGSVNLPCLSTIFTNSIGQDLSIATFQSKLPRPSLNVDKPKSARYRSTAFPSK